VSSIQSRLKGTRRANLRGDAAGTGRAEEQSRIAINGVGQGVAGAARYIASGVRHRINGIGLLGVVAPDERHRCRREAGVGIGRLEPLLSRPGQSFDRSRDAGDMVGVLRRG
jgi:hypothetical protein